MTDRPPLYKASPVRLLEQRWKTAEDRLGRLVVLVGELADLMPICARCSVRAGMVMSRDRWWLCDGCWAALPWPEGRGQVDLRAWWARAMEAIRWPT